MDIITELALLLGLAAVIGAIARWLRQPMILAYIIVGLMVSIFSLVPVEGNQIYATFAELGVTFLLFMVGLEINVTSLKKVGPAAIILGVAQIVLTFVGGYFIALLLGIAPVSAAYIAIAMTFSSTVIVVKLLSERQDLNNLYGKMSLGILLVQDIVAVIILVILAGWGDGVSGTALSVTKSLMTSILLFIAAFWLGRSVIPKLFFRLAHSEELLFLVSLAWLFCLAAAVEWLGLSIEIGGFLAGLTLANSSTHYQIASRIRPLRDFFIALFFIMLGATMVFSNFAGLTGPIIIFSLFVLIGNPLIVLIIMGLMGYHRRTSFLTGVTIAQISEFSLVLAAMGLRLGHIQQSDVTIITAVGIITIAVSSYMIIYSEAIYKFMFPVVSFFHHGEVPLESEEQPVYRRPYVLIGAHRVGHNIALNLPKEKMIIIEYDPDVLEMLRKQKYLTLFGDSADTDILGQIDFTRAQLVISTMPNADDNLNLLEYLADHPASKPRKVIVRAENDYDADKLYAKKADYVFRPPFSVGHYLGQAIAKDPSLKHIARLREHDQKLLYKAD